MTTLDLLFVMGQALTLASLVYFLRLLVWWRLHLPADLKAAERSAELRRSEESSTARAALAIGESPSHQDIVAA